LWGVKVYQHIVNVVVPLSDNSGSYLFMAQLALGPNTYFRMTQTGRLEGHLWPEFGRNPDSLAAVRPGYRIFFLML